MASAPRRSNPELASARYEHATPAMLARTPAMLSTSKNLPGEATPGWTDMREHLQTRLMMLRSWRTSEIEHDALVANYLLPRRSMWLTQGGYSQPVPNSMIRNLPINQAILDPTGTQALRVCAAGLMEGLMSPSRPWFKLAGPKNFTPDRDATLWFEETQERMYAVMAGSNFYDCGAQMMEDLPAFGTGPMLIYEDDEDVIRCYNPAVGEYYLGLGATNRIELFYRMFVYTVSQMVEAFGLERCPVDVKQLWAQKGGSLEQERIVAHAIEPNFALSNRNGQEFGQIKGDFTWREIYWVYGASELYPLSVRGFKDEPFIAPRWWLRPSSAYGDSPGKDALPDIMQLQQETMRKAELLEKHVRPPLNVPVELKNQPSSILPGRQNYTSDTSKGIQPIFKVDPAAIQHISADLALIQQRIKVGFFNDLFLMLLGDDKTDRTAYEIAERKQEKMQILGPVIERFNNEAASKAIKRIFNIMVRKRLVPPLPGSLRSVPIQIEYISMLALAQRAVKTAGLERLKAFQGSMAATDPRVLLITDNEFILRDYADSLGVGHKNLRPPEQVEQMWKQQQQAQQRAQQEANMSHAATEIAPALTDAAKNLSDTDVGGGINAMQLMLQGGGGAPLQ